MTRKLVMIHGMWGGAWCWENYRPFFEERGWETLAPTLRYHDHPPSEAPPSELATTSLLDYAADLEAFIRGLPSAPVLMGHSMGGLLVQILASRGLGRAAVLLTPASPAGILALRPSVIRSFARVLTRPGFWKKTSLPTYPSMVYSMAHLMPEEDRKAVYERLVPESGRATFEIGLWPLDRRHASRVDASSVKIPMLVVGGIDDKITPSGISRQVAKKYGADFQTFEKQAHWVLGQPGWNKVAESVSTWLDETLESDAV